VAEDARGVWELVDGLQRVSTILEFMGLLKDSNGSLVPPSRLVKAGRKPRLPSIEGALFKDLSLKARLSLKRAGCRVEVIKTGSKPTMKYEVFERLNTGGSELTSQEVRNCIFRATNPEFVQWVETLAEYGPFKANLGLSEFQQNTMFDHGLILRFFTIKNAYDEFEHDVEPFITDFVREILEGTRNFERHDEEHLFKETFKLIGNVLGEDSWRHFRDDKHKGPLSVYVFEIVSTGIAVNIDIARKLKNDQIRERIIAFKQAPKFVANTGAGANIISTGLSSPILFSPNPSKVPLMNLVETVLEEISDNFDQRRLEITNLRRVVQNYIGKPLETTAIRMAIPMLYAQWEGYIKEVCQLYLEYIETSGTRIRELRADLLAYLWTSALKPLVGGLDFVRKKAIAELALTCMENPVKFADSERVINTKSNLNFGNSLAILSSQ
jgi:hypothetical protein